MTDDTFAHLMARLRSGEDAAAREVFERFAGRLVALARGRFNRLLAHKVDPEDVVQSAFKSFFVRHRAGKLDVRDCDGLWNLLALITLRKCADRAEYFLAERRDAAREATGSAGGDGPDAWLVAPGREPVRPAGLRTARTPRARPRPRRSGAGPSGGRRTRRRPWPLQSGSGGILRISWPDGAPLRIDTCGGGGGHSRRAL